MHRSIPSMTLAFLSVSLLTACGGSGTESPANVSNDNQATETNKSKYVTVVDFNDRQYTLPPVTGERLTTTPYNENAQYFVTSEDGNITASGDFLSYVRFGIINDPTDDGSDIFARALPQYKTPENDIVGLTAHYTGYALHGVHTSSGQWIFAPSTAQLDVTNGKKVTGVITVPTYDDQSNKRQNLEIALQANIQGNQFHGWTPGTNTEMTGGFYGAGGAELTGIYKNISENFSGVFGAKISK